jgi:hypothetical protein
MNKAKRNFWFDILLLGVFALTIVSLGGHHSAVGIMIHSVAGALLILGSLTHVIWHWDWIKANILHYPRDSGQAIRANRRIDLPLLVLFAVCGVSGLLVGLMDMTSVTHLILSREGWSHLHHLTGSLMFLLMLLHLGYHVKWLVCMARKCFAPGKTINRYSSY